MRLSTLYLGFWMVSVVLVYFEWVSIIGFVSCSFVRSYGRLSPDGVRGRSEGDR